MARHRPAEQTPHQQRCGLAQAALIAAGRGHRVSVKRDDGVVLTGCLQAVRIEQSAMITTLEEGGSNLVLEFAPEQLPGTPKGRGPEMELPTVELERVVSIERAGA